MEIKVCVGSACYVKGSDQVIKKLEQLVKQYNIEDKILLKASFCLGNCTNAVSVQLDEKLYGLDPNNVETFFKEEVLRRL